MPPAARLPNLATDPELDEVPLNDIPELDQGELRADTLEFEKVTPRVVRHSRPTRPTILIIVLLVVIGL